MRPFRNSLAGLGAIFLLATAGYYFHRHSSDTGYAIVDAPRDLVSEFVGLFSGNGRPATRAKTPDSIPEPATGGGSSAMSVDNFGRGRRAYLEADYDTAVASLEKAVAKPAPGADKGAGTGLLARAQLFRLVLAGVRPGSGLEGPPQARIALAGGDPFVAALVDESETELTFRKAGGISARVKKAELKESQIARTPEQKQALAESEYQRRHAGLRGAAAYLDLARFCRACALPGHVTYLLEKSLEEPGDAVERAAYDEFLAASTSGRRDDAAAALDLLRHFFRAGDHTRAAVRAEKSGTAPPAGGGTPADEGDEGGDETAGGSSPASGIGSVGEKAPRGANPELNAVLDRADKAKAEGDAHYLKAQPGAPDRAEHREKALKAYTEAIELYEKAEEQWGVSLERVFKQLYERRYQMLKDTPAR